MVIEPELYDKFHTCDNIILHPAQIVAGQSEAYQTILHLFAASGHHDSYRLASSLRTPTPQIDGLAEMFGHAAYPTASDRAGIAADIPAEYTATDIPTLFERGGLWGYAAADGTQVIAPIYNEATEFSCSLAVVCLHGVWQAIGLDGRVAISDPRFSRMKPFSEGLAAVEADGRWGYIDTSGALVIAPAFDMAGPFSEGLAVVRVEGRYGFADKAGRVVIEPQYDHATGFRNGTATVQKDGETQLLDRNKLLF